MQPERRSRLWPCTRGGHQSSLGTAVAAVATVALLAACGGAGSGESAAPAAGGSATPAGTGNTVERPATRSEAARFLTQATFGPTAEDIDDLIRLGYAAWIDRQFTLTATSHRAHWESVDLAIKLSAPTGGAGQDQVFESFWQQAAGGPDQLRLRVAFALSQIFVVSAVDGSVSNQPRAMAAWLDMLGDKAFGNYRDLLETVSLHPLMGLYLTHIKNRKPDNSTGRIPDQNYARESMQLFSLGLVKLNRDGTAQLEGGRPVETYGPADVAGLSHVFTGFSWACPGAPSNSCFNNGTASGTGNGSGASDPDRYFKPMLAYPAFHSTEAKSFLGVTIPAQSTADPAASLRVALDTLANHTNVGPFIGKQLIQRLVTSNPSPAYVQAVAAAFDNNGSGVRGDLKAVIKAVLMHPEARRLASGSGKVREPVLRLSAYLRAFAHTSDSGNWRVGNTDNPGTSLGQTVLRAPSVFNFYRPGYVAPGTQTAAAGLVAPEMQLLNESSAAGWINFMRDNLASGVGQFNGTVNGVTLNRRDLQRNWAPEMALAGQPAELVASVADKLLPVAAGAVLLADISAAVNSIAIPALNSSGSNQAQIDTARRSRVNAAVLLVLATPEFQVQQ